MPDAIPPRRASSVPAKDHGPTWSERWNSDGGDDEKPKANEKKWDSYCVAYLPYGSSKSQACATFTFDDLEAYAREQQEDPRPLSDSVHSQVDSIPYESIEDYALTMKVSRETPLSKFLWPADDYKFNKHLAVALRHLPPDGDHQ